MDSSMQKPLPRATWHKVVRRIIILFAIILVADRAIRHYYPVAKQKIGEAFDDHAAGVKSSGNDNTSSWSSSNSVTTGTTSTPPVMAPSAPARNLQLLVSKQSCMRIEAATMAGSTTIVQVVNECPSVRAFVQMRLKAINAGGIVVKSDYSYIVGASDEIAKGEHRQHEMTFEHPDSTTKIILAVDSGQPPN